MTDEKTSIPGAKSPGADFEGYPLTRSEYISMMIHFYRGEMSRANTWRNRLDNTTNWAVVTAAALLSFAFSQPEHSHVTLLLANMLVTVFLGFEARRFRYFDVWRSRIRMIEENFLVPMIRRNLVSPRSRWRDFVAHDLDHPTFKITYLEALAMRLRRNYIWLYGVILVAWLAKLNLHPDAAGSVHDVASRASIGALHGPLVLIGVVFLYALAIVLSVTLGKHRGGSDEVHGVEAKIDEWKT